MELGNFMFGNSRGEYPVDREIFSDVWFEEFADKVNCDGYGYFNNGKDYGYENEIFKIMPYDWDAECDCGFQDLIDQWYESHKHKEDCYQNLVKNELIQKGWIIDKFGWLEKPKEMKWKEADKVEHDVREKYCNQFNLTFPNGCAVHCTCGRDEEFDKYLENKNHKEECRFIQPNFLYKPTGFKINWYKYAFRDSYMNQNISIEEFKKILKHCVESYYKRQ